MTGHGREQRRSRAAQQRKPLTKDARVLALIPHFECEEWLDDALESLAQQTRPLDGIVVIDDASDDPADRASCSATPASRCCTPTATSAPTGSSSRSSRRPTTTPTSSRTPTTGRRPTGSRSCSPPRSATGAELIGTQEMRVFCDEPEVAPIAWPLDVEGAVRGASRPRSRCCTRRASSRASS